MSSIHYIGPESSIDSRESLLRGIACNKTFFEGVDISEETITRMLVIIQDELRLHEVNYIVQESIQGVLEGFAFGHLLPSKWYYSNGVYVPPKYRRNGIGKRLKLEQHSYAKKISGCLGVVTSTRANNTGAIKLLTELGYTTDVIPESTSLACEYKF